MHGQQNIKFCCDSGHAVAQAVGFSLAFHLRRLPSVAGSPGGVYSAELRIRYSIPTTLFVLYWLSSLSTLVYACQSKFHESFRLVYNNKVELSRAHFLLGKKKFIFIVTLLCILNYKTELDWYLLYICTEYLS